MRSLSRNFDVRRPTGDVHRQFLDKRSQASLFLDLSKDQTNHRKLSNLNQGCLQMKLTANSVSSIQRNRTAPFSIRRRAIRWYQVRIRFSFFSALDACSFSQPFHERKTRSLDTRTAADVGVDVYDETAFRGLCGFRKVLSIVGSEAYHGSVVVDI